jgi:hypothetical protein
MRTSGRPRLRIAIFLAGVAALIAITVHAGADAVVHILGTLGLFSLAAITLLHLPVIILMGLAWWCVGRDTGRPILFIGARLVRDSVAEVLPFSQIGGFVSGLRLLALAGSNVLKGAFAMLADLILEFSAKLFYTLLGIVVLVWLIPGADLIRPFSIALICLFATAAAFLFFRDRFKAMASHLLLWVIRQWAPLRQDDHVELNIWRVFDRERALPNFAIHLGCWLFGAFEAWITLRSARCLASPRRPRSLSLWRAAPGISCSAWWDCPSGRYWKYKPIALPATQKASP